MNEIQQLCDEAAGTNKVLQGNIAFAVGCVRAGIHAADGYPGTPSTEAIDKGLSQAQDRITVGWSVNEAVAVSVGVGHAMAGRDCVVTMKIPASSGLPRRGLHRRSPLRRQERCHLFASPATLRPKHTARRSTSLLGASWRRGGPRTHQKCEAADCAATSCAHYAVVITRGRVPPATARAGQSLPNSSTRRSRSQDAPRSQRPARHGPHLLRYRHGGTYARTHPHGRGIGPQHPL